MHFGRRERRDGLQHTPSGAAGIFDAPTALDDAFFSLGCVRADMRCVYFHHVVRKGVQKVTAP
ncbi:hypothetical protein NA8A_09719 [Nitratireductor indicus C115]|uniref:Uncharacterized protein n=1 Tax=Nitratireductor indicus C115 TaxID=1231190 RepID=K2P6M0_9HYPH|nr:hypothetical protein NA8A_09719 [Nitratireductor indicus C115]